MVNPIWRVVCVEDSNYKAPDPIDMRIVKLANWYNYDLGLDVEN